MDGLSRYNVHPKQAGVNGKVLANKPGFATQREIDDAESVLLRDSYEHFYERLALDEMTFDVACLFEIHRYFLGPLYAWAGRARTVDISKDGTLFAPVAHLDNSIARFSDVLRTSIPERTDTKRTTAQKLAFIHTEFIALHPFRDGNGRTVRLFLDLLAERLGYGPIDWSRRAHETYVRACISGMSANHDPMARIVYAGLSRQKPV